MHDSYARSLFSNLRMTQRARLVVYAHALDFLTLMMAGLAFGLDGEINPVAKAAYAGAGWLGIAAFKIIGVVGLVWLVNRIDMRVATATVVCVGVLSAVINLIALWMP